jgi:hypothetical protein
MSIFLLILIISYVLGIFLGWKWTNICYNPGGILQHDTPNKWDLIIIFIPIFNIGISLICWICYNPYRDHSKRIEKFIIKFFKIKE